MVPCGWTGRGSGWPGNSMAIERDLSAALTREALALGFDAVGITGADNPAIAAAGDRLQEFLHMGRQGDMAWLAEKADRHAITLTPCGPMRGLSSCWA